VASAIVSPLSGKTIVVTRAAAQSDPLCAELNARGAKVKLLPLISFAPPEDYSAMDAALKRLESFDWLLFTSANAVQAVEERRKVVGDGTGPSCTNPRVAVVGPATAEAAAGAGFSVDFVAAHHSSAGLLEELGESLRSRKVFLPRSDRANPDLPTALRGIGATVTEVVAYRTLPPSKADRERVLDGLKDGVDGILFYSPSAVQSFLELVGHEKLEKMQGRVLMVAIGPTTAGTLSAAGVQRIAWAADTTTKSVIEALEGHLSRMRKRSAGAKEG
jgi:uroporphyrinogen-III synthase